MPAPPQATRGVFVNIALQEPFGLTVIEAAAHGVPTVATKNGEQLLAKGCVGPAAAILGIVGTAQPCKGWPDQLPTFSGLRGCAFCVREASPVHRTASHQHAGCAKHPWPLTTITQPPFPAPAGGPVDIMATLHHGVVVDPTDADAVAAALLRILTAPSTWDDMSSSGVKNIMVGGGQAAQARGCPAAALSREGLRGRRKPLHPQV